MARTASRVTDVAVVGAGPAGLSAAVAAADAGARVVLIDAEPVVGGQFWRHPAPAAGSGAVDDEEVAGLHHDLAHYHRLRRRLARHLAAGTATHLARHEVWSIEPLPAAVAAPAGDDGPDGQGDGTAGGAADFDAEFATGSAADSAPEEARFAVHAAVFGAGGRRAVTVNARSLVLATGAYDLQLPFPGWDLPGVMTAGGVQSLLKGHAVLAGSRVVVAGTGPFLLSVAAGLLRSGATVPGVFEAARPAGWLRELRTVASAAGKLAEGVGYTRDLLRHKAKYHSGWTVLSAAGNDRLETVTVAPLGGDGMPVTTRSRMLAADVLAVGWGFVPQLDLPLALGCETVAGGDGLPVVLVDPDQRSTVPGVYAAGEICGVGGAALAAIEGEIAGGAAAEELAGRSAAHHLAERAVQPRRIHLLRRRASLRSFAGALQRVYPVPDRWPSRVPDDTVVCRCEEVTAGAIREVARRDGAADARTVKLLVRPGMGWCQGRICGYATDCLAAAEAGASAEHRPVERTIASPVPLGLVASETEPAGDAPGGGTDIARPGRRQA